VDDGEFASFFPEVYPRMVGQLRLLTGDLASAEDIAQEAFVRAASRWRQLARYDQPEAWVRKTAFRLAIDHLRRAARHQGLLARLRARQQEAVELPPEGLTGTGSQLFTQNTPGVPGIAETGDNFGLALAAGDFGGDGFVDLAVGGAEDVGTAENAGAINVLPGSAEGLTATGSQLLTRNRPGVPGSAELERRLRYRGAGGGRLRQRRFRRPGRRGLGARGHRRRRRGRPPSRFGWRVDRCRQPALHPGQPRGARQR
jgi:hypothetical protein